MGIHQIQIENYQLAELIQQGHVQILQLQELIRQGHTHTVQNHRMIRLLNLISKEVEPPFLASISLVFQGVTTVPTPGPVTLTAAGQQVTASVLGFDQFGQPFLGEMPAATLTSDDTAGAIVTFDPASGLTTAVANGVANITASLTSAEGLALSDTEAVTVAIPITPPPPQVLSSIKVAF